MTRKKTKLTLKIRKRRRDHDQENATPSEGTKTPSKSPFKKKQCRAVTFSPRKAPRFSPAGKSPQKPKKHENCTKSRTANKRIWFEDAVENYDDLAYIFTEQLDDERFNINEQEIEYVNEVVSLLPDVLTELRKAGLENVILDLFKLACDGKFPVNNISFLLWTKVVQWFKLENTSKMRYMDQTKKFWKLGMRHFGGKFVRYMTCFKNTSDIVFEAAAKGQCNPMNSDINFAMSSEHIIRNFNPYNLTGLKRCSGIYTDVMEVVAKALEQTSACLTFDGNKIKQGPTENTGDIDLLGFEEGIYLRVRGRTKESYISTDRNSIQKGTLGIWWEKSRKNGFTRMTIFY